MLPRLEPALLLATVVLVADSVPTFNVQSFCRRVAEMARPVANPDVCLRNEQEARDQLVRQWTQFPPADRSYCRRLATIGGDPTYTELLTCLELQRDARNLREKDEGTSNASPRLDRPGAPPLLLLP
jgi:hypothetical protein